MATALCFAKCWAKYLRLRFVTSFLIQLEFNLAEEGRQRPSDFAALTLLLDNLGVVVDEAGWPPHYCFTKCGAKYLRLHCVALLLVQLEFNLAEGGRLRPSDFAAPTLLLDNLGVVVDEAGWRSIQVSYPSCAS